MASDRMRSSAGRPLAAALTRGDRSAIGRWFWTIDKTLLIIIFALVAAGIVAVAAASPAAARRLSGTNLRFDDLFFLYRQLGWVALGLPLMLATSMLDLKLLKRLSVIGTLGCLAALLLVPFIGGGANGAARWIQLPGFQFQPSEFFKPCFIVTTAWLLSLKVEDRSLPTMQISLGILGMALICLIAQPDVGQSALISAVWLTQAMLAGLSLAIVGALAVLGVVGLVAAYFTLDHFAARIDKWVMGTGDTFQIDKALDCFRAGGWLGTGPGEGRMKFRLPEAQTDYIFSVIGEEFGLIACFMLAGLFMGLVVRALLVAMDEDDPFVFLATSGLAAQFGFQAAINMMVNLALLPSKGMTLPFISHGGSSYLAICVGAGLLLALTRCNPFLKGQPWAKSPGNLRPA
ncbi:FtsW/RodA/SpoVE family cell cycle protein [Sandarakinorhabdus oryzae]|uniref:FtsW/RodA/SpoVE family cell cycle protein n=1 Tax=Sandarakinorhabdus oryzae TaxID=2675220 RepID=UPI001F409A07|nr:putative peptidoglycan glycosyltransferase FtsW [Sandarakinorhabdus oryzae]